MPVRFLAERFRRLATSIGLRKIDPVIPAFEKLASSTDICFHGLFDGKASFGLTTTDRLHKELTAPEVASELARLSSDKGIFARLQDAGVSEVAIPAGVVFDSHLDRFNHIVPQKPKGRPAFATEGGYRTIKMKALVSDVLATYDDIIPVFESAQRAFAQSPQPQPPFASAMPA